MGSSTDKFRAKQLLFWLIVMLLFSAGSCANQDQSSNTFVKQNKTNNTLLNTTQSLHGSVWVRMPDGRAIRVGIAQDEATRTRGLSGVDQLAQNEGMWFEFDSLGYYPFWMKDMKFSIDIIWVDENYRVTDIVRNVPVPQVGSIIPTYQNTQPAKYVLEVNAGVSAGLVTGDTLVKWSNI